MNRIEETFARLKREGRKGLIPFITAGDPNLAATRSLVIELVRSGASLIELGIPFSDPMADGPVIQRASERALQNDFGVGDVLDLVADVRRETDVPIILFSYYNPLLQYDLARLCRDGARVGIDGVLVTDLSPEEAGDFSTMLRAHDLSLIFLIAPTSTEARLRMVAESASGFVYAVSRAGVTGARESMSEQAETLVHRMRALTDLPVAVGFGISRAEQVKDVWRYADAAVVGSAIVAEIENLGDSPQLVATIGRLTKRLLATEDASAA